MTVDTNVVNYGIAKLTNAFPMVQNFSERYVHYIFVRAMIEPIIPLFLFIGSSLLLYFITKHQKKKDPNITFPDYETQPFIFCVLSLIVICFSLMFFINSCYFAMLALIDPLMFAITIIAK